MRILLGLIAFFAIPAIAEGPLLTCGQEASTRQVFCVDPKAMKSNGDLRGGDLWTGGPNRITKSGMTIIVNCQSQVSVLQDERGVNIGGGRVGGDQPAHMTDLFFKICALKPGKANKNLRQF